MKNALWSLLLISSQVMGATIAVIDSGVDVEHKDFLQNLWKNYAEIADNGRDEDKNGYEDDFYGWNFAEQNNYVIDRKYIGSFSSDPSRFLEIQGKMFLQMASEEEINWVKEKTQDQNFIKEMSVYGNFVHGTHVAGITLKKNPNSKILSVKLIPTEIAPFAGKVEEQANPYLNQPQSIRLRLLEGALKLMASEQMKMLEEISSYVGNHKADIANGSFGTGFPQAVSIVSGLYKLAMGKEPETKEMLRLAKLFMDTLVENGKDMAKAAPNTLFVFASGNDGLNNDLYGSSPTNVDADNVISVGATYNYDFIAPFSNYGIRTVDVAAPGMLIHSQVPGDEYVSMSGTSQAAPYVSNVAAQVKDTNTDLTPKQIKKILMKTVDVKAFLKNKIKSQGIVNLERAVHAAKLSLTMDLDEAILEANASVKNVKTFNIKRRFNFDAITPIPLTPQFI